MTIEWDKLGSFVQAVGVPFAILLIFVGPFVYLSFLMFQKYGSKIAEAHFNFLTVATDTQKSNADTLVRLELAVSQKNTDHRNTHGALSTIAAAGIDILDDDKKAARSKLEKVEVMLSSSLRNEGSR